MSPSSSDSEEFIPERTMLDLYRRIESLLPDLTRKVIQFIGSSEGEGTSTVVREFGRVMVRKLDKSVLILDADQLGKNRLLLPNPVAVQKSAQLPWYG